MVTADLYRSVDGVTTAMEDMDLMVLAPLAVLGAGGAFIAQEAVDLVFPQLGMTGDPSSPSGLGLAAAFKVFLALVLVALGTRVGGRALTGIMATLGIGVLVHAGLDVFDMVQRGGLPGSSPSTSSTSRISSGSSSRATATPVSRSSTASRSNGSSGASSASSPRTRRKETASWG